MLPKTKYKAIPCYFSPNNSLITEKRITPNDIWFGSKIECRVYALLRKYLPAERIDRQVRLLVKPKTTYNAPLWWKCDFRIYHSRNESYLNIEVKGFKTNAFIRNIQYLELHSPYDWKQLIIVTDNLSLKIKNFTPYSLEQLEYFLKHNWS